MRKSNTVTRAYPELIRFTIFREVRIISLNRRTVNFIPNIYFDARTVIEGTWREYTRRFLEEN